MNNKFLLGNIMGPVGNTPTGETTVYINQKPQEKINWTDNLQDILNINNKELNKLNVKIDNHHTLIIDVNNNKGHCFSLCNNIEKTIFLNEIHGPEIVRKNPKQLIDLKHPYEDNTNINHFKIIQNWGNRIKTDPVLGPGTTTYINNDITYFNTSTFLQYDITNLCKKEKYSQYYIATNMSISIDTFFKYIITYSDGTINSQIIPRNRHLFLQQELFTIPNDISKDIQSFIIYPIYFGDSINNNIFCHVYIKECFFNPNPNVLVYFKEDQEEPQTTTNIELKAWFNGGSIPVCLYSYKGYENYAYYWGPGNKYYISRSLDEYRDWWDSQKWSEHTLVNNNNKVYFEFISSALYDKEEQKRQVMFWLNESKDIPSITYTNVWDSISEIEVENGVTGISTRYDPTSRKKIIRIYDPHYNTPGSLTQFIQDLKSSGFKMCVASHLMKWSGYGTYDGRSSWTTVTPLPLIKNTCINVQDGFWVSTYDYEHKTLMLLDNNTRELTNLVTDASVIEYKDTTAEEVLNNWNLTSPDGKEWSISINNDGTIVTNPIQ